jgi:hypothetical protein
MSTAPGDDSHEILVREEDVSHAIKNVAEGMAYTELKPVITTNIGAPRKGPTAADIGRSGLETKTGRDKHRIQNLTTTIQKFDSVHIRILAMRSDILYCALTP